MISKKGYKIILSYMLMIIAGSLWAQETNSQEDRRVHITINTDKTGPDYYRFWDVRVLTNQMYLIRSASALKSGNPYMKTVNCVRLLGGRPDGLNQWYKGVDKDGNIIVDFSDLVKILDAIVNSGYKPYIVLDNVPTAMSSGELNHYGNCKPPIDYQVWRQYIETFMKVLIDEFGTEQVKTWQFRVGTEPDLFPNHWNATREEYFVHYDITVDAVTKILPEAIIGPGNILNPSNKYWIKENSKEENNDELTDLVGTGRGWGLSIIDYAAAGTNKVTGKKGTKMDFFGISYYDAVGGSRPILLDTAIQLVRERLDRYPSIQNIPIDIQEFGILHDENGKRLWGNDITEWGASWYAVISDIVYRNNVRKVYEWSTTTGGIPHPRAQVINMLEKMVGGKRIDVNTKGIANGHAGALACIKDEKMYVLLFSHHLERNPQMRNTLDLQIQGSQLANNKKWLMNEWTVDADHGVWVYQMYTDFTEAGLEPNLSAPIYDGNPRERFGNEWQSVFEKNQLKYERIAKSIETEKNKLVDSENGVIQIKYDMPSHCVKLIELVAAQ